MAYVNRELAISEMEQVKKEHSFLPQICIKAIDVAINAFKIVPTADVEEVKHGKWLQDFDEDYYCSVCGSYPKKDVDNYCPNCGAKMDGRK